MELFKVRAILVNPLKNIVLKLIILLLLTGIFLSGCRRDDMQLNEPPHTFSELIETGNLDDLSMTIYYITEGFLTPAPMRVIDVINHSTVNKVIIAGTCLEDHINLLKQLINTELVPAAGEAYVDARIYYMFETEKEVKVFDVAMWGAQIDDEGKVNTCLFVNGIAVNVNDIFYDVIMPFLPEDAVNKIGGTEG